MMPIQKLGIARPIDAPTINGHEITPFGFSVVPFLIVGGSLFIVSTWLSRRARVDAPSTSRSVATPPVLQLPAVDQLPELLVFQSDHVGGAAVSERPWPGVDARLSRYAYLVSLRRDLEDRHPAGGAALGDLDQEQTETPAFADHHALAGLPALVVLAADGIRTQVGRQGYGAQNLDFLGADLLRQVGLLLGELVFDLVHLLRPELVALARQLGGLLQIARFLGDADLGGRAGLRDHGRVLLGEHRDRLAGRVSADRDRRVPAWSSTG